MGFATIEINLVKCNFIAHVFLQYNSVLKCPSVKSILVAQIILLMQSAQSVQITLKVPSKVKLMIHSEGVSRMLAYICSW